MIAVILLIVFLNDALPYGCVVGGLVDVLAWQRVGRERRGLDLPSANGAGGNLKRTAPPAV